MYKIVLAVAKLPHLHDDNIIAMSIILGIIVIGLWIVNR